MNHRGWSSSAASVIPCRPGGTGTVESVGLSSSRTVTPGGNADDYHDDADDDAF
jgi:hypothetical protein